MEERMALIREIWKQNQWLYVLTGFFAGILVFPALQAVRNDFGALLGGFVPEGVGIAFTVIFIDRLYRRHEQERETHQLKERLIREMGSPDNVTAVNAIRELSDHGWLLDGSLTNKWFEKADLHNAPLASADLQKSVFVLANLSCAKLTKANLKGACLILSSLQQSQLEGSILQSSNLYEADLREAQLTDANLEDAILEQAKIQNASIHFANLKNANLTLANLEHAILWDVNLQGANLRGANLSNAMLENIKYDKNTVLPNGEKCSDDVDFAHFTNPNHPNFWRSENPFSPAYRGKTQD